MIQRYQLTVAPKQAPDLANAASLFQAQCAARHGAQGRGDGSAARGMNPAPSNFHDAARMDQRSIYGLYNTVTLGVHGTPMRAFTELSDADRWVLAFYVSGLRNPAGQLAQGDALWRTGTGKTQMGDFRRLVTITPADLAAAGRGDQGARRLPCGGPVPAPASSPSRLISRASNLSRETSTTWTRACGARPRRP